MTDEEFTKVYVNNERGLHREVWLMYIGLGALAAGGILSDMLKSSVLLGIGFFIAAACTGVFIYLCGAGGDKLGRSAIRWAKDTYNLDLTNKDLPTLFNHQVLTVNGTRYMFLADPKLCKLVTV